MKQVIRKLLRTKYDIFVYLGTFLCLCALQLMIIGDMLTHKIVLLNTLDFSWQTDSIERLLHGYVAGRDFIFTYGPLYQLIASLPSLLWHLPSYVSLLYANLFFTLIVSTLLFVIVRAIGKTVKERTVLFLLGIILFIQYPSTSDVIRILLPFLYTVVYFKFRFVRSGVHLKHLWIFILPGIFGLYTFDIFLLCFLLTFVFEIVKLSSLKPFKLLHFFVPFITIVLTEICISLLLTQNLNYILYSLDTVKNYQFIMNIPWAINKSLLLLLFPVFLIALTYLLIQKKASDIKDKMLFVLLSITAILNLKSGFIRSDEGHILMALYPSILVLIFYFYKVFKLKTLLIFVFVILVSFISYSQNYLQAFQFKNLIAGITLPQRNPTFFDIFTLPKSTYTITDLQIFSSYINRNPQNVMIYPYDTFLLNIYGQTYNTLPLQFYQYSNSVVELKTIAQLAKKPPKYVILGIDGVSVVALDSIPNFTRNPEITKWLLKNYSVEKSDKNYLILMYNPNKSKASYTQKDCLVYNVTPKNASTNILDSLGKPATFFLDREKRIRLPYSPANKSYLLIEGDANSETLQKIFSRPYDFSKYTTVPKEGYVFVKQYAIPVLKTILNEEISVECY